MTLFSGANQPVETRMLKRHTWKADAYSIERLPRELSLKSPSLKLLRGWTQLTLSLVLSLVLSLSLTLSLSHAHSFPHHLLSLGTLSLERTGAFFPLSPECVSFAFLSPKLQGLFFCLCNLFPESTEASWFTCSSAHFCDFLNKCSLAFESWL